MEAVSPTVRVELESERDGDDLLEALSVRGLGVRTANGADGFAVDVEAPPGEEGLWNLEIVAALEAWLEETQRPFVVARLGGNVYTVRAPGSPPPPVREPEPAQRRGVSPAVVAAGAAAVVLAGAAVWLLAAAVLQAL